MAKHHHLFFALLLLGGLLIRLPHLGDPPYLRSTRPYIGLMQARHLYFQWEPPAEPWRAQIAADFFTPDGTLEFPVQALAAASLYWLIGHESILAARLLPVLAWLLGAVFLHSLARFWLTPAAALVATSFYLFAPFGIGLSRLPQPDALMVALLLGAWWAAVRRQRQPGQSPFCLPCFIFSAMLVKPTCGPLLLVPIGALLWEEHGRSGVFLRSRTFWLTLILPMAMASSYYAYRAAMTPGLAQQADMSFVPELYIRWDYLSGWWNKLGECAGQLPFLLGLLGVWLVTDPALKAFLRNAWLGYIAYGLLFNYHISTHDYYSLPLLPILGLSLGAGVDGLGRLAPARRRWLWPAAGVLVFVLGWSALVCWQTLQQPSEAAKARSRLLGRLWGVNEAFLEVVRPGYGGAAEHLQALREIGRLVQHSRHCLFLTRDYANSLNYQAEVSGLSWPMVSDLEGQRLRHHEALSGEALLAEYRRRTGAEYFIVTNLPELLTQKDLLRYLGSRGELLAATDYYRVYRLRE